MTDTGKIPLSDTATFTVTVNEVNSPPVFDPRSHYGKVGQLLTFATAMDTDIPAQQLAFSLGLGAPAGLSINAVTGVVTWTPTADQAGVHPVTVTATDNGVPPLTSAYTYSVEVVGSGESLLVGDIAIVAGKVVVRCLATVGKSYQLQSSQSLSTLTWLPLGAAVKATSPVVAAALIGLSCTLILLAQIGPKLIGVDLGPNLSVTGSLATILWLTAIRREGEDVAPLIARLPFPSTWRCVVVVPSQ